MVNFSIYEKNTDDLQMITKIIQKLFFHVNKSINLDSIYNKKILRRNSA